jgi:hypothetical protein
MRTQKQILDEIRGIECALSPENLYCDGECSHAEASRKERELTKRRAACVKELGREPTDQEIYG